MVAIVVAIAKIAADVYRLLKKRSNKILHKNLSLYHSGFVIISRYSSRFILKILLWKRYLGLNYIYVNSKTKTLKIMDFTDFTFLYHPFSQPHDSLFIISSHP